MAGRQPRWRAAEDGRPEPGGVGRESVQRPLKLEPSSVHLGKRGRGCASRAVGGWPVVAELWLSPLLFLMAPT